METTCRELRAALTGRLCILGVGNRLRGDDGAGCALVDRVSGQIDAVCLDGGSTPENILEKVVRAEPDTVLIVDAARLGAQPGAARLIDPSALAGGSFSTHAVSLEMACDYVRNRCGARVTVLGIQPGNTAFRSGLSPAVADTVESLGAALVRLRPRGPAAASQRTEPAPRR